MSARARHAMDEVEHAAHKASPWICGLARAGFVARAVLYATLGVLAIVVASGGGADGHTLDTKGALAEVQQKPFGQWLLAMMAAGLAGYTVWLFVQTILDPEHAARDYGRKHGKLLGVGMRAGWALNAIVHAGLVVYAVGLITGAALAHQGDATKGWTAQLMAWPAGRWIVAGIAIGVGASGVVDVVSAVRARLDDRLDLHTVREGFKRALVALSRFGLGGRALAFILVAISLLVAAFTSNPADARGLDEALRHVQQWRLGALLLAIIALGFIAYGMYEAVEARWRRIRVARDS